MTLAQENAAQPHTETRTASSVSWALCLQQNLSLAGSVVAIAVQIVECSKPQTLAIDDISVCFVYLYLVFLKIVYC